MGDLFEQDFEQHKVNEPLAARLRPQSLDQFYGQQQWLGPGGELRLAVEDDRLLSCILYGPPGCGKTSFARLVAKHSRARFVCLNAVLSGVKELRKLVDASQEQYRFYRQRTILFVDEVHRWNKAQQDLLLPWVEDGVLLLLGATTQNPYFEVNSALLSRVQVVEFHPLSRGELQKILHRALTDTAAGYGRLDLELDEEAQAALLLHAHGDARALLNALEAAVQRLLALGGPLRLTLSGLRESLQQRQILYSRDGDQHYDTISAFIKSIRGSDADAALYWLARMLKAGEDPKFIWRRLLISASEDVGLAAPQALTMVEAAASAFERVGFPEGQYFLAQATIYLALAAKSNSAAAFFAAQKAVEEQELWPVPQHLRDQHGPVSSSAEPYLYPHDYPGHWVKQRYLPAELETELFYQPGSEGFEARIRQQWAARRKLCGLDDRPSTGEPD